MVLIGGGFGIAGCMYFSIAWFAEYFRLIVIYI